MTSLLASRPDLVRLVRSGMSALPLREDFWGVLAHGVGITIPVLRDNLAELYDSGVVVGMGGEPNPTGPLHREALVSGHNAPGALVRWRTADGGLASCTAESSPPAGTPALRWVKVGWFPDLTFPQEENLLLPSVDRSLLDIEPGTADPPLSPTADALRRALESPRPFLPPDPLWDQIAALVPGCSPGEARASVAQLVATRRWRRFALRLDLTRVGWRGCGMAGWNLAEEDAPKAAQALARVAGSGDIALRRATPGFPCTLTALLIGREPGSGHAAAERISAQWNRPLAFWQDVVLP
ncbi:MAG: hypothetical protein PWP23_3338 [Candidatus Sumerlaeota bacterium]|nr:hypothetical protein [Candidatus Sumerlaeota bacterium]